jgi:TM2 domain-containing membrane protein YozV
LKDEKGKYMAARFCENCGDPVSADEVFCEKCGNRIEQASGGQTSPPPAYQAQSPVATQQPKQTKNPIVAALLSLLLCGVGQMYNGQWKKGIVLLVGVIILAYLIGIFAIVVTLFAIYDAYTTANKINNGEQVKDLF